MKKRIAVVGAGAAGITAALELKDRGFEDVTVFGHFNEAQLVTVEEGGISFDVAACLLHTGYRNTIIPLVKRFGLEVNYLTTPADLVDRNLKNNKKEISKVLMTLFSILLYLPFFFGWLLFHNTSRRKGYSDSMEAFLTKRGLKGLAKSIAMGPGGIAQGYGFLDEVTAYHAMRWFRPRLFATPLLSGMKRGVGTIKSGYGSLFKKILSGLNQQESIIKEINPIGDGVELITDTGDSLLFDEVIIACPPDNISFPNSPLLKENAIEESSLFSYLFTSPTPPVFKDRAYIIEYIDTKQKDKALVIRTGGQMNNGNYLYWAVGYKSANLTDLELKKLLEQQFREECGLEIEKVIYFKCFRYNLRFSGDAVQQGIPHQFEKLQGEGHIWYSGGFFSHWDTSSIYEHNRRLVNKLIYSSSEKSLLTFLKYKYRGLIGRLRLV